uniref:Uncharacterized protein n=1 Tax=Chelydra serpentina TaxID=8475 RepID=A0A8C3SEZ0_CHESE
MPECQRGGQRPPGSRLQKGSGWVSREPAPSRDLLMGGGRAPNPPCPRPPPRLSPAGTSTPPAIAATPVSAIPATLSVNGYSPVPTQSTGQPASEALYTNGVHPYPGTRPSLPAPCPPTWLCQGLPG